MVCRSFSISTCWPNVINIQGWSLPDHGCFITDDKPCSGKASGRKKGGGCWGCCLKGDHSHHKGQRQTVMLLRQPQTSFSLSPSVFCFSCQENWQAVRIKKRIKLSKLPTQGPCSSNQKKESKGPPTWQNKGRKRGRKRKCTVIFRETRKICL